jgi:hypothetical protein
MIGEEGQRLLNEYATKSREFSDAVNRLRSSVADAEVFMRALSEAGTARRACERSRIRLDKHLAGPLTARGQLTI